ncbi:MAG: sterol desaturase family protein [Myxococcaceae bacterium]
MVFAVTILSSAAIWHATQIHSVSMTLGIAALIIFLIGNIVEYILHRYPLHNVMRGCKEIFKIHSKQHHQYFTNQAMDFETSRDFRLVFFPIWSPVLLVVASSALSYYVLSPLLSPEIGHLFGVMAPLYLLIYEMMHLCYHLNEKNRLTRLPGICFLRLHHVIHHDLRLMNKYNFNLTLPMCDWLCGTLYPKIETMSYPPWLKIVPILSWAFILYGFLISIESQWLLVCWWLNMIVTPGLHLIELYWALPIAKKAGYSAAYSVFMTLFLGATWWKPLS